MTAEHDLIPDPTEPSTSETVAVLPTYEEVREDPGFDLATKDSLTFTDLERGRQSVFRTISGRDSFRNVVDDLPATGEEGRRKGLGLWMLADYERCAEQLAAYVSDTSNPEAATAAYTRARALSALGRHAEAAEIYRTLCEAHANHPRPRAGWIEAELEIALVEAPENSAALADEIESKVSSAPGDFAQTSDGRFLMARACELRRDWETALDHYAAGRELEPDHHALLIRFGHLANRWDLDAIAIDIYEELVDLGSTDRKVLLNLGVLYEDAGRDADAATCYDLVLRNDATDDLARLYLNDARAGIDMFYDEDLEKKEDRLNQILRIPITDFELSVRARNCLNKMQITTLGDLVQRTEQELLSYKNFGETSLTEIKEILHSKGLRLGMPREEAVASIEAHASRTAGGDRSNVMNKPILELQLSIRARRTVETLGCLTVGDIQKHSAEELLGMPNFGQTSLQELRSKLAELGVKLKGD
jgi:DNA-directed RNA polymerase subunit alpha